MRKVVNLSEARNQLSSLVDYAASGEEAVIARHGLPMAKLVAVPRPRAEQTGRKKEGKCR